MTDKTEPKKVKGFTVAGEIGDILIMPPMSEIKIGMYLCKGCGNTVHSNEKEPICPICAIN